MTALADPIAPNPASAPWLIDRALSREEQKLGESLDYLRDLAAASIPAFLRFAMFGPMASYRKHASPDASAVARIVAVRHEDCGPCLQTVVNLSLADGADLGVVRATLARDVDALPADLAVVYRWSEAVVRASPDTTLMTRDVEEAVGSRAAVAELALAVAASRVFPTLKRGLGHAVSCQMVDVVANAA